MCGCESEEAWFDWKQNTMHWHWVSNVSTLLSNYISLFQPVLCMSYWQRQPSRSGEWCKTWCALFATCRSQSTWNHIYILYRTESLGPEKGLLKGGSGPSCTRPHTEKDHKQADSQDTSFFSGGGNVQTTGIISQNSKGIPCMPDTRSRNYLVTECSTYVLMHEKKNDGERANTIM